MLGNSWIIRVDLLFLSTRPTLFCEQASWSPANCYSLETVDFFATISLKFLKQSNAILFMIDKMLTIDESLIKMNLHLTPDSFIFPLEKSKPIDDALISITLKVEERCVGAGNSPLYLDCILSTDSCAPHALKNLIACST